MDIRKYKGEKISMISVDDLQISNRDIPKTPIYYYDEKKEYASFFTCPCCNMLLGFAATDIYNYCNNCGQALDWDEPISKDLI